MKAYLKTLPALAAVLSGCSVPKAERPNIIYLMFDDLGYGDLGCYGQELIETPNIDALAARGIVFTDMYSAAPLSAPSRCSVMTGLHCGHSQIRGNDERWARPEGMVLSEADWYFDAIHENPDLEGQWPLAEGTATLATMLSDAGYATAMIGKWGLGGPGSGSAPGDCGFDYFYGFNCQMLAHSYYPDYLWENDKKVPTGNEYMPVNRRLRSYDKFNQKEYSCDLMYDKLERWVGDHAAEPFFLMWTTTVPHSTVQAPEEEVMYYVQKLGEEKTPITDGGWYYPVLYPHSAYAAMITHIDTQVGRLVERLKELGIYDNTLIIITSDNGPAANSNSPGEYFKSGGPFKCRKGWGKSSLHEGGIRMPFVVSWGDRLTPGRSSYMGQFTDLMPTFAQLAGAKAPQNDGISFVPTLKGQQQPQHPYLYWEFPGKQRALRLGQWKCVTVKKNAPLELYDIRQDPTESTNLAAQYPEKVKEMEQLMRRMRTPSPNYPIED